MPYIYFRLIWQLLTSLFQISIFLLAFFVAKALKKTKINFIALISTTLVYLFLYMQPSFVQACMRLLSCRKIAEIDYITDNVSYLCDTINWKSMYIQYSLMLVIPMLLLFVAILPGIFNFPKIIFIYFSFEIWNNLQKYFYL